MEQMDYFFDTDVTQMHEDKVYVLVIYDIVDNKKRVKFSKFLQGYGFRIQKSAFEAYIEKRLYKKLKKGIEAYVSAEDSIRIYKIIGKGQVTVLGKKEDIEQDDIVII